MSRRVNDVVDASGHPYVSILVPTSPVTGKVEAGIRLEIGGLVTLVVTETGASHTRPGLGDRKNAFHVVALNNLPSLGVEDLDVDSVGSSAAASSLGFLDSRKVQSDVSPSLCLPVGVDHSGFAVSYNVVVPVPGSRINGFANASKNTEGRQVVLLGGLVSEPHERADGGRGSVKYVDLVPAMGEGKGRLLVLFTTTKTLYSSLLSSPYL